MGITYRGLLGRITVRLKETTKRLNELRYKCQDISPKEFYDYMTGETPTGDTITISDVLDNDYLMIHEVVELSELKRLGTDIDTKTVMNAYPELTYETHYTATRYELDYALAKKDYNWVKVRMNHAKSWLKDPNMPRHLAPRYKAMMQEFSKILTKEQQDREDTSSHG